MNISEWLLIAVTAAGPVLAVQAQKWVERAREAHNRKLWIFNTLMMTRGARVAPDHVRALNGIDLAFYGHRVLGKAFRGKAAQAVLDVWHDYHEHLSTPPANPIPTEADQRQWNAKGDELFLNLLQALAEATHHKFDRQQLRMGGYMPIAQGEIETEQKAVRQLALRVLSGQNTLKMDIASWPVDQAAIAQQKKWQGDVLTAIEGTVAKSGGEQPGEQLPDAGPVAGERLPVQSDLKS
jgi:hypothetical protein